MPWIMLKLLNVSFSLLFCFSYSENVVLKSTIKNNLFKFWFLFSAKAFNLHKLCLEKLCFRSILFGSCAFRENMEFILLESHAILVEVGW